MSGMMDKVKAKVDNVLHKDKNNDDPTGPHSSHTANTADPTTGTTGHHSSTDPTTGTTGHHSSGVDSGLGTSGTHGSTGIPSSTTHGSTYEDPRGPHSSTSGNKLDPRVDSDTMGSTSGAYGTTGSGLGHNDPTGPHGSHAANKADPRVGGVGSTGVGNSGLGDVSGTHTKTVAGEVPGDGQGHLSHLNNESGDLPQALTEPYSEAQHHSPSLKPAHSSIPGDQHDEAGRHPHGSTSGIGSSTTGYNDPSGPHGSHAMNSADPRVGGVGSTTGSGVGSGQYGSTTGPTASGGLGRQNDPTGPHGSHTMNSADPRVGGVGSTTGSGVGSGQYGSTTGPGGVGAGQYGSTTGGLSHNDPSGPHGSHAMNSADPRVGGVGSTTDQYGSTTGPGGIGSGPYDSTSGQYGNTSGPNDPSTGKPSMKEKLHPKVDADGDGKAGIMS